MDVDIREVGPRDGLQAEAPLPVEARARLVASLVDAGVSHVEVCSFVSPRAVPAMADAANVVAGVVEWLATRPGASAGAPAGVTAGNGAGRRDVRLVALVPNAKGAEMAVDAGLTELSVTVSASPVYSQQNVGMTIDESLAHVATIASMRPSVSSLDAVVSCAFGSPYEGDIAAADVAALADRLLDAGATSLTYADTTGMATPRLVDELVAETGPAVGLHLHDTRGTAIVNAYAALLAGVRRFDTSVGGLGGSPFAAGAAGNLATEDLVHLLDDLGYETGIDLGRLLATSELAATLVDHPLPSRVARAGPRSARSTASDAASDDRSPGGPLSS